MNSWKNKTAIITLSSILLLIVGLVGYDVFVINIAGTEASVSYMFYEWSFKYPFFTWCFGFVPGLLVGHFFWRLRDTENTKKYSDMSRE